MRRQTPEYVPAIAYGEGLDSPEEELGNVYERLQGEIVLRSIRRKRGDPRGAAWAQARKEDDRRGNVTCQSGRPKDLHRRDLVLWKGKPRIPLIEGDRRSYESLKIGYRPYRAEPHVRVKRWVPREGMAVPVDVLVPNEEAVIQA